MISKLKSWFQWHGEEKIAKTISKILWPPTSAATITTKNNKILAIKTSNYYMLPGGIVEPGESFEQTAKRETKEETNIEIKIEERIEEKTRSGTGVEIIFKAEPQTTKLEKSIEGKPVWLTYKEAKKADWRHNRKIQKYLKSEK